ncbi:MAG: bifunctional diaminohydroxyphosphoribosylaminopyrimidine deaminase/5-amino-6-(5-phosphoribosylamino)uracil reductase RibD [Siculibacillus sp.]|nr:bifunctional diaminohydroxyphosphoribosylaminopyrimidine deaminase/5-amino-6-(5-phosphoribosylamino)uracil reductase RibD [Siculibacillus sp.]
MSAATSLDRRFMAAAIRLGRRHLGRTAPNPSVGALVVANGPDGPRVVGRGVTALGGRPHAEPQALAEAGAAARGATLYVTLEPCSHHGRTPPCTDAITAAGITRVVVALGDPDPRVAGHGFAVLRGAGIEVVEGVEAEAAREGLAGHLSRVVRGRPWVLLKLAVSADRMLGRRDEANVAVTGRIARARAQVMRAEADAVLVGIGTAAIDDPELTVRLPGMTSSSPVRIVLDGAARLSPRSRLARSALDVPVRLLVGERAEGERRRVLAALGVDIVPIPEGEDGRIDPEAALARLAADGIGTLMVEGGAEVARSLVGRGLVDEIALFDGDVHIGTGGLPLPPEIEAALRPAAGRFAIVGRESVGPDRLTLHRRLDPPGF